MGWWRNVLGAIDAYRFNPQDLIGPVDTAERHTDHDGEMSKESVGVTDRVVVEHWLRELRPDLDQQVFVHRTWGTVSAMFDREEALNVFLTDGHTTWHAVPPGGKDSELLTPQQTEHVVLDALTSPGPPEWPDWRKLI